MSKNLRATSTPMPPKPKGEWDLRDHFQAIVHRKDRFKPTGKPQRDLIGAILEMRAYARAAFGCPPIDMNEWPMGSEWGPSTADKHMVFVETDIARRFKGPTPMAPSITNKKVAVPSFLKKKRSSPLP